MMADDEHIFPTKSIEIKPSRYILAIDKFSARNLTNVSDDPSKGIYGFLKPTSLQNSDIGKKNG